MIEMARPRRKLVPVRESPALVKLAEDYARARGLKGEAAAKAADVYLTEIEKERARAVARFDGEPGPPRIEEWIYAMAPTRPEVDWAQSGKWMVFTSPSYHEEVWGKIKAATEAGELGFESKTPNPENAFYPFLRSMLTCVYTYDFEDIDDVRRVLVALRRLDLMNARLSYKRDADTISGWHGQGVASFVSQPRSLDIEDRREA